MPNLIHIDKWLQRAEPDYYSMFINAWIPFNAWYVKEFQNTHDRYCLDQICTTKNKIKNKLGRLLTSDTPESRYFKYNIAKLQDELIKHPIPDESPIDFRNVLVIDNPKSIAQEEYSYYRFKWEYIKTKGASPKCKCIVSHKTKNNTIAAINLEEWDEEELCANNDYLSIVDPKIQEKVFEFFQLIKPRKSIKIVVPLQRNGRKPQNAMVIDSEMQLYFVENVDQVCKAVIEMLYKLRCMIFHGNIDPTTACGTIYEYAFNLQRVLIKELV